MFLTQDSRSSSTSLRQRLYSAVRSCLALQFVWALVASLAIYGPTLALQSILSQIEGDTIEESLHSGVWQSLCIMLLSGIVHAIADAQTSWQSDKIKLRLRNLIVYEVYGKILQRSLPGSVANAGTTPGMSATHYLDEGTVTNLTASDAEKLADAGSKSYQILIAVPVRLGLALYLLYQLLGLSALAGVAIMLAITPINSLVTKHMGSAVTRTMSATDTRVQETDQLLRNLRTIKLFALGDLFQSRLSNTRSTELKALKDRLMWWEIMATIWYTMPSLITFVALVAFTAIQQRHLQPSVAFTALAMFGLLKAPLDQLVGMLASVQESLVSIQRIQDLLSMPKPPGRDFCVSNEKAAWLFENATLTWPDKRVSDTQEPTKRTTTFSLSDLNLVLAPDKLHVLTGSTGSGKTTLIMALLGEISLDKGQMSGPNAPISYCAQEAWLVNDTVKNNILFGSRWDASRYEATIYACALTTDIAALGAGDATVVGERGSSLSGGQKQRVALARAVYADSSHVLIDECLSAVDTRTAKWLVEECIAGPLMRGRTCVIATHAVGLLLPHAATVTVVDAGTIAAHGSPAQLSSNPALLSLLITKASVAMTDGRSERSHYASHDGHAGNDALQTISEQEARLFEPVTSAEIDKTAGECVEIPPGSSPLWSIWSYLTAMGGAIFWLSMTFLFVGQQLANIMVNWWLSNLDNVHSGASSARTHANNLLAPEDAIHQQNPDNAGERFSGLPYYLGVYSMILAVYAALNFARLHAASVGSLRASAALHRHLLSAILRANFESLARTSHGTMLGYLSRDMSTVDNHVMPMALGTIHFLVMHLGTVAMMAITIPRLVLPGVLLTAVYFGISRLFLSSTRELERIKSVQQAELQQHISQTLLGVITIRAFRATSHSIAHLQTKLDLANRPTMYIGAVDHWLALRLNIIGTAFSFAAGCLTLLNLGSTSPRAIGLMLTYTMTFSDNVMWMVRYHALNEQNFAS